MYKRQKGFLPLLTMLVGYGFVFYFIAFLIYAFIVLGTKEFDFKSLLLISLMMGFFFIVWGCFFGGMFPNIKITEEGIDYKYLTIFRGMVLLRDIADVVEIQHKWFFNGYFAVLISRKSFKYIDVVINKKGLWFQHHYGRIIGYKLPAIWISPKMVDEIKLIKEMVESSNRGA